MRVWVRPPSPMGALRGIEDAASVLSSPARVRLVRAIGTYIRARRAAPILLDTATLPEVFEGVGSRASSSVPLSTLSAASAAIRLGERLVRRLSPESGACLPRAIGRYAALRELGLRPSLVLGMKADGGTGHAWVEVEGRAVLERTPPRYVETLRWPS